MYAELWKVTVSTWFQLPSRAGKRRGDRDRDKWQATVWGEPVDGECDQWATLWDAWRWKA
ncbi:hypothetical protein N7517_009875 [Penicillium concentricum]|uniref:Uncharacterized protein n=1 Tax=Penicillium concentricum TaxID=293559 RepID=A0A9W9UXW7_9EURO|nr:uncharacterized protein N7517_009875 [Penicillium concentricum]KAJ5360684.1 hypothetical protein N7517_009875 [Penicillium concentricum]